MKDTWLEPLLDPWLAGFLMLVFGWLATHLIIWYLSSIEKD